MKEIICRKCAGRETISNFKHVEGGRCFTCNGSRVETVSDDTIDIVKEIREEKKKAKDQNKQFETLFNEHKHIMSNNWRNYITNIGGDKLNKLQNYISFKIEMKEKAKMIDINDVNFESNYKNLLTELENKYMIEEE